MPGIKKDRPNSISSKKEHALFDSLKYIIVFGSNTTKDI